MTRWQRIKHVMQRPSVFLLSLAVLFACVVHVACIDPDYGSVCSRYFHGCVGKPTTRLVEPVPDPTYSVYRTSNGLSIRNADVPLPTDGENQGDQTLNASVYIAEYVTAHGFWAVTGTTRKQMRPEWTLEQLPVLTWQERRQVEAIIQARRLAYGTEHQLDHIDEMRIMWLGYVVNTATVMALVALVCSIGWIPRYHRRHYVNRCLERRICPRCEYDLAGLPGLACPECGWKKEARP